MKNIFLTALLMFSTIFSQESNDSGTVRQIGGYRSFAEFANNAPSVQENSFELEPDQKLSLPNDTTFNLMFSKRGRLKSYPDNLWGYSDSANIYIAVGRSSISSQKFRKLNLLPFYSYYTEPFTVPSMLSGGKMNDPDNVKMETILLITKTGQKTALTKQALREILRKENTALYQEFLADNRAGERVIEYLEMLNKRLQQ